MYELTCTFSRPLSGCNAIRIGLIEEDKKETQGIYGILYFDSYPGEGAINAIRGEALNSSKLNAKLTVIKFRFCIETKQIFMFDESKNNIIQGDANSLKLDGRYRFGVFFNTPGDNYGVTVSNFKSSKDRTGIDKF